MRRRITRLAVGALVLLVAMAGTATGQVPDEGSVSHYAPAGAGSRLWLPSESYEGGAQGDARLDMAVRLWTAGMPLQTVFEAVRAQTGVEIGCRPRGDDDERVCITAYLNPADPPSLRGLMAQLMWVTECDFAWMPGEADAGEPSYSLLSTDKGLGALERLREESLGRRAAIQGRDEREFWRPRVAAKVEEYRQALALSPRELGVRYRSRASFRPEDDVHGMLLLNMLDPSWRAATELICGLPEDDLRAVLDGGQIAREWEQWSADEQELLRRACVFEEEAFEKGPVVVCIGSALSHLYIQAYENAKVGSEGHVDGENLGSRWTAAASWPNRVQDEEWVAISRHLGEVRTATQEDALRRRFEEARRAREADYKQEWQDTLALEGALSPEGEAILASAKLEFARFRGYAHWQILELVAHETGSHVLSDCFYQPMSYIQTEPVEDDEFWEGELTCRVTALDALRQGCMPYPRLHAITGREGEVIARAIEARNYAGWEWGDAGSFLRFRSVRRDLWRGGMLPREAAARIDEAIEPFLPDARGRLEPGDIVRVALDLAAIWELAKMMRDLTPLQTRLGGALCYEDPSDEIGSLRQGLRSRMVEVLSGSDWNTVGYRFVGSLSQRQLERIRGEGLSWGGDLTEEQRAPLRMLPRYLEDRGVTPERLPAVVVQIVGPVDGLDPGDDSERYTSIHLRCSLEGVVRYDETLGASISVEAQPPEHLVGELGEHAPPSAAGPE